MKGGYTMKKILIVIDMQNDFISGSLGSAQAQAIVPAVKNKIEEYKQLRCEVIFTRDTHSEDYLNTQEGRYLPVMHCVSGTDGWMIHGDLSEYTHERCIDKPTFGWKNWGETLHVLEEEIEEIELCGLCTDICVVSNAILLKTHFPETKITVDAACCAGVTEESHIAALLVMSMCQVNVVNNK
jgi:nicotinamidase-related amidase